MSPTRRRSLLAAIGSAAAAGCLGNAPADSSDGPASDPTGSDPNDDPEGDTLHLAVADGLPTDRTVRVHPRPLANLLERGAAVGAGDRDEDGGGKAVRATGRTIQTGQPPILPGERTVRLTGDEVDDGAYALDVDGGLLYEWLLGATAVADPPADAEVVPVEDLTADRRSLAVEAIEGGRATVEPHTPLGTWARTAFVGGYVRYDGTVYRGRERRQTDAAFFSEEVWYVGTVTPAEEASGDGSPSDAPTLHLDPLPAAAARLVDDLLGDWASTLDPVEGDVSELDDPARRALAGTELLLTHVAAFEVRLS